MDKEIAQGGFDQIFGQVAQIVCETLDLEALSPEDGFFDVGGHSLAAVQVVERINTDLGVDLSLRRLFELETVRDLAAEIQALQGGAPDGTDQQVFEGEI